MYSFGTTLVQVRWLKYSKHNMIIGNPKMVRDAYVSSIAMTVLLPIVLVMGREIAFGPNGILLISSLIVINLVALGLLVKAKWALAKQWNLCHLGVMGLNKSERSLYKMAIGLVSVGLVLCGAFFSSLY